MRHNITQTTIYPCILLSSIIEDLIRYYLHYNNIKSLSDRRNTLTCCYYLFVSQLPGTTYVEEAHLIRLFVRVDRSDSRCNCSCGRCGRKRGVLSALVYKN